MFHADWQVANEFSSLKRLNWPFMLMFRPLWWLDVQNVSGILVILDSQPGGGNVLDEELLHLLPQRFTN